MTATEIATAIKTALGTDSITIGGKEFIVDTAVTTAGHVGLVAKDTGVTTLGNQDVSDITPGDPSKTDMIISVALGRTGSNAGTVLDGGTDIKIAYNKTMTGAQIADKFMENLGSTKEIDIDGTTFTVSNDNGKLTFEMKEDPTNPYDANLTANLIVYAGDGTTELAKAGGESTNPTTTPAPTPNANWKGATINQGESIGVNMIQTAKSRETRHMAQADFDLESLNGGDGIKDGTALKIGNETYVFAVGHDSKYKDMANVVDLTHMKADTAKATLAAEASRVLSNVAKDNKTFAVTTDNVTGKIRLTERPNSGIDYNVNDLEGSSAADLHEVTAAAWKDLIQEGIANLDAKPATTSGGLMLQIGDTSDDYNQLRVSIGDMHTTAMGIADLSIADQDSAAAAIQTIKDAINYVSSVRGDLGAIQNRLEHTQNNLSVMAENIQDAESTIRDTDVAQEMMSYVKNNILVQSAQAMLAQANQVPQGVLQLLG